MTVWPNFGIEPRPVLHDGAVGVLGAAGAPHDRRRQFIEPLDAVRRGLRPGLVLETSGGRGGGIGFGIGLAKGTDWTKKNRRKKNENKFEGGWLDPMVNRFPNGLVLESFGEGRF